VNEADVLELLRAVEAQDGRPPGQWLITAVDDLGWACGLVGVRANVGYAVTPNGRIGSFMMSTTSDRDALSKLAALPEPGRIRVEDREAAQSLLESALVRVLDPVPTHWREVEVGRGSSDQSCPVVALETWIKFGRIARGPLFRRIFKDNKTVDVERLSDKHVARLVKQTALAAGVRSDLPEGERELLFAGHSLRAGLASSAEIEERYVQKQLGHASAEMTRKYQRRRDRFRTNLTKASGL
jgi:hypothetical protein